MRRVLAHWLLTRLLYDIVVVMNNYNLRRDVRRSYRNQFQHSSVVFIIHLNQFCSRTNSSGKHASRIYRDNFSRFQCDARFHGRTNNIYYRRFISNRSPWIHNRTDVSTELHTHTRMFICDFRVFLHSDRVRNRGSVV